MNKRDYKKIKIDTLNKAELKKLLKWIEEDLENKDEKFKDWLSENILDKFIKKLFQEQWFKEICEIASKLNDDQLVISDCLFEVAYSFSEINNKDKAEYYYNEYLNLFGESSAVLNNLGVIYENRGDLEKALSYFEKAKNLDQQNDTARKNYERVNSKLIEKQQEDKKFQDGLKLFKSENSYIQNKFLTFCGHRREDGLIVCPYRQLPQFLGMSAQKAPDVIKDWLDKRYIQKIISPDPNVSSSVYKVNPYLEQHLLEIQKGLEKEKELLEICQNLNTKSLDLIGYNETLEKQLETVISNKDLKELLKRDLKENALAIITKSYKSALVLSGSIIEAILLDRLHNIGVRKTQIQKGTKSVNKKLEELDFNELLDVAKNNNLIDENLLHLSHGVRGFRNLIHPGVEQRKKSIKISEENVMLAWTIVKKVLFEIK